MLAIRTALWIVSRRASSPGACALEDATAGSYALGELVGSASSMGKA
jgi:hypothetical protein